MESGTRSLCTVAATGESESHYATTNLSGGLHRAGKHHTNPGGLPHAHLFGYGAYTGTVPLQPAGGTYTFTYTPAGGTSGGAISIPVAVVNAPMQITQPKSGAVVPIPTSVPFTASYTPSGLANTSVYGVASDSRVHVALSFTLSEPGSLAFKTEDFHDFAPGPGNLSLARVTSTAQGNTPFAQVNVSYENIHTIPITWQ
jgi:hypothetical protein